MHIYSRVHVLVKKANKVRELKRYLQVCSIGKNGLLVVRKERPFAPSQDLTVIPVHILPGLLSALHLRLQHPTKTQLTKVFHRYFYALDADKHIEIITSQCPQCASVAKLPREVEEFSTSNEQPELGTSFACDVLCRARQRIFIIRDAFSSFTVCKILPDEKSSSLKTAIIETIAELKSPKGCKVRVDGATSLQCLSRDSELQQIGIAIEVGRLKNRNKNPVGEKAVQELEYELKRCKPDGGSITSSELATATATLNKRVRNRGLTAKEILLQRDSLTRDQLNFSDKLLAESQHKERVASHGPSSRSHARTTRKPDHNHLSVGDLIYIKGDGDKHSARDAYIVTSLDDDYLYAQKLRGYQFRSKLYTLKYSEVFRIPSTCPKSAFYGSTPNRQDLDDSDDDDALCRRPAVPAHQLAPIPPEPPPNNPIVDPELRHDVVDNESSDSEHSVDAQEINHDFNEHDVIGDLVNEDINQHGVNGDSVNGDINEVNEHNQPIQNADNNVTDSDGSNGENHGDMDQRFHDSDDSENVISASGSALGCGEFLVDSDHTSSDDEVVRDRPYYVTRNSGRVIKRPGHLKDYECS